MLNHSTSMLTCNNSTSCSSCYILSCSLDIFYIQQCF